MAGTSTATMTIVFCDLVESTPVFERLGPARADTVRRRLFEAWRSAIEAQLGRVVKTAGDGLMATFASVTNAIAASAELQRGTRSVGGQTETSLALRVGMSLGEVTVEAGDCFGTPVVEASRLCAAAPPGAILAADIMRVVAGARSPLPLAPAGSFDLKGLAEPVPAVNVAWEHNVTEGRPPLAHALEVAGDALFAGRDTELASLTAAWHDAVEGKGGVILISGEPGIGKTRIAAQLAELAYRDGAIVVFGRCDEAFGAPFQPFAEALRSLITALSDEVISAHVGAWGSDLARLAPELVARSPGLPLTADTDDDRWRVFEAVTDLLARTSRKTPLLLVLDDLHWATAPTVALLRHVAETIAAMQMLVVGTYRDTDLDRMHPLGAALPELRRSSAVTRLALRGLGTEGVVELLRAAAGSELPAGGAELAHSLWEETDGNPFFVVEVLRNLVESGELVQDADGIWTARTSVDNLPLPDGVREVIGRRLSRLSDAANAALRVAAVIGPTFTVGLLERVPDAGDPAGVLDAVEEAAERRIVIGAPDGSFSFAHALTRASLLAELSAPRRARIHRNVADAMQSSPGPSARRAIAIAQHFIEAGLDGDVEAAAAWAIEAIDQLIETLAFEEAIDLADRALAVLDLAGVARSANRAELLLRLQSAIRRLAVFGRFVEVGWAAIEGATTPRQRGEAIIEMLGVLTAGRVEPGVLEVALETVAEIERVARSEDDLILLARVKAAVGGQLVWSHADPIAARPLIDSALDIARRTNDADSLAISLGYHAVCLLAECRYGELRPVGGELMGLVDTVPAAANSNVPLPMVWALMADGSADELRAHLDWLSGWTARRRSRVGEGLARLYEGALADAECAFDDAYRCAEKAIELVRGGGPNFEAAYAALLATIMRDQGRTDELVALAEAAAVANPGLVGFRALLAVLFAELGELDRSRALLLDVTRDDGAAIPMDMARPTAAALLTDAAWLLVEASVVPILRRPLAPLSGFMVIVASGTAMLGAADRYLAQLAVLAGDLDASESLFESARALENGGGFAAKEPWTLLRWAQARHRTGREWQPLALAAKQLASRSGMAGILKELELLEPM